MSTPEPNKPDPLILLARASAGRRRRPRVVPALVLLAVIAGIIALFVWWIWPAAEQGALTLAVFDQVGSPGERVTVQARLESTKPGDEASLTGSKLFLRRAGADEAIQAATDARGAATFEVSMEAAEEVIELDVRYPGIPDRRRGAQGQGRVFAWPPETALLVVDVESLLAEGGEEAFWTINNLDLVLDVSAVETLREASKQYRVVYVSSGADRPSRYSKLRAFLATRRLEDAPAFPAGPVLAAAAQPEDQRDKFPLADLERMRRFRGAGVGITRDAHLAQMFRSAGLRSFLIADKGEPDGVQRVDSWAAFRKQLGP